MFCIKYNKILFDNTVEGSISRARRFPLLDRPGQVKLPVGQEDLDKFFFFTSYKQIEEF